MEDFQSKYSGEQVEAILDSVANGEAGGGGGGIAVETDPVFSASPAASITEEKKAEWEGKYTKPIGGIPASDLAPDVFLQGEKGEQGEQGPKGDKGDKGDTGADGATFTPSVDANGNLSWSNDKGLENPPTVNIKGPKGDSGEGGGGASSDGRKEVIYISMEDTITNMRPNVIYWVEGDSSLIINSFEAPTPDVDTYDVFTAVILLDRFNNGVVSLTLPDYVMWANGVIPEIDSKEYELSISRISDGYDGRYFAVLTPFKSAV